MNSQASLADRIWIESRRRARRNANLGRVVLSICGVIIVGGAIVWPRSAFAIQEVEQATQDFNTVRWTEHDEGVIRDLGSPNPKRVPFFSSTRQHFVSRKPLDVRAKWDTWNEWRGLQQTIEPVKVRVGNKTVVKKLLRRRYQVGASKGLTAADIAMELSSFSFLAYQWDPREKRYRQADLDAMGWTRNDRVAFGNRTVVGFESRHLFGKNEVAVKLYADPKSKRMVFYRLEYFAPDGSRIYLRTLTDIRYDAPAP